LAEKQQIEALERAASQYVRHDLLHSYTIVDKARLPQMT
jgi:hypothetical protein